MYGKFAAMYTGFDLDGDFELAARMYGQFAGSLESYS
jgi:hypothetical protein